MAKIQEIELPQLQFAEGDAPAAPSTGVLKIYAKADGKLYSKNDSGTETELGGSTTGGATWGSIAGTLSNQTDLNVALAAKEPTISGGTVSQFWAGTKAWRDLATDVRAVVLTGLSTATNAAITATDTVLTALGKLQKQITDHLADAVAHITGTERTNWNSAYSASHSAVTVADTTSIDLTLTGQQISAATIFGTTAGTVCQGNDSRLSDARTPTAHNQTASTITDFATAALAAAPAETTTTVGALTNSATAKATPVDADMIGLMDSAASNVLKKLSWTNVKATLKTYFDTLYQAVLVSGTNIKTVNGNSLLGSGDVTISGSVAWGNVTGTLSSQTDLNTALAAKLALSGGTMTGALVAQNNTNYTTAQARNITLSTSAPSGGGNGDIWFTYTA